VSLRKALVLPPETVDAALPGWIATFDRYFK
jgi:hypothetical protein